MPPVNHHRRETIAKAIFAAIMFLVVGVIALLVIDSYSVEVDDSEVAAKAKPTVKQINSTYGIRSDGMIMRNNEPFFLFGFNHVADVKNRYGDKLAEDVGNMLDNGFNTMQILVTGPNGLSSTAKARDLIKAKNAVVIASYYKPSYTKWIDSLKVDSSILAWNMHDDFNVPYKKPKLTPKQRLDETTLFKSYAESVGYKTLSFGSGGGYPYTTAGEKTATYLFGEYKDSIDIAAVQSYPISNSDASFAGAPLEENSAYLKYARAQMPADKPVIANLQTFKWKGNKARYPNVSEIRNMTYAALVHRLNGIINYAYYEDSGLLPEKAKDTWAELIELRKDIDGEFLAAIMNGTYKYVDTQPSLTGKGKIHAALYTYTNAKKEKAVYIILINTSSAKEPLKLTTEIEIPKAAIKGTLNPQFNSSRYGNSMQLTYSTNQKKAYISGEMQAEQVQVYKLSY